MKKMLLLFSGISLCLQMFAAGHIVSIVSTSAASCYGMCDGSMTATVAGGVGPFGYSWNDPSSQTNPTALNLCAGSYTVTVTDSSDMSIATTIGVITQPTAVTITSTINDTICSGASTTLIPPVTGGTPPYTYMWTPLGTGLITVSPASTTSYTLIVTDANGCSSAPGLATVYVNASDVASFNYSSLQYCLNGPPVNPTITGTPGGVFTGTGVTSASIGTFDPPVAGPLICVITYTTSGGCPDTSSVTLTVTSIATIAMTHSYTTCLGSCTGLSPVVAGGTPIYSYSWLPASGLSASTVIYPTACPASTTTYTLTVTDAEGCTSSDTTEIIVDPPITLSFTSTNSTCASSCDGTATATVAGGVAPFNYSWTGLMATAPMATNLCPGVSYSVSVIDYDGCIGTDSITINSNPAPHSNFSMVPDSLAAMSYWAFDASSGSPLNYIWYFGDGDSSFVASPTHVYPGTGTYNICLIVSNPANPAACFDVTCDSVVVPTTPSTCLALFNAAHDTASTNPNAYIVTNLSYGSTLSYLWSFGDGATSTLQNPTHAYGGTGAYQICLTVDNGSGCTQTFCDSIAWVDSLGHSSIPLTVTVVDGPTSPFASGIQEHNSISEISVYPNPFSENTTFVIQSKNQNEIYSFELMDVLGKKVKSISGINEKQFSVSREGLENGIYFYKITSQKNNIGMGKLIVE